jgi:hypothetical protein
MLHALPKHKVHTTTTLTDSCLAVQMWHHQKTSIWSLAEIFRSPYQKQSDRYDSQTCSLSLSLSSPLSLPLWRHQMQSWNHHYTITLTETLCRHSDSILCLLDAGTLLQTRRWSLRQFRTKPANVTETGDVTFLCVASLGRPTAFYF